jgi:transposase
VENAQFRAMMSELRVRGEELGAENAELKRRLGQNSRNSSKPPSSDSPFVKPAPKSLRRASDREPGGQPGHSGSTLALVDKPDEGLRHEPGPCTSRGADLAGAPAVGMERWGGVRSATDDGAGQRAPAHRAPLRLRLWDHHVRYRGAGCDGAGGSTGRGSPRSSSMCLWGVFLSKKRTAQALAELFATPVSEGTVATVTQRAADGLEGFLKEVTDRIAGSEVAGFDETGLRVAGRLHWVHCARTGKYTLITCHPKRGSEGIDAAGVLTAIPRGGSARRRGALRHLPRRRTSALLCPRPA